MKQWRRFKDSYFLHSFKHDRVAIASFVVLLSLILLSFLAPIIAPHNPYNTSSIDIMDAELPPSWMEEGNPDFILGTDIQGRDLLSTMLYGMRLSVMIGCGAVFLQAIIGIFIGMISGYMGGKVDAFLMRIADVQLSFSTLMVAIMISAIFQVA
ncbi:MAG: ABC transporter permease, partial [Deltaproteobacteria bacterium]|nr:ABC transporter permease [Deltaproteobacteria bacterium]